jgi:hypothetical protein
VRQYDVTTQEQSPTPLLYVSLYSSVGRYDTLYLRNYLTLNVNDELSRLNGKSSSRQSPKTMSIRLGLGCSAKTILPGRGWCNRLVARNRRVTTLP